MNDLEAIQQAAERDRRLREQSRAIALEIRRKNAEIDKHVAALLASLDTEDDRFNTDRGGGNPGKSGSGT